MALQNAVDRAIMVDIGGDNATEKLENINLELSRHPYPAFNDDNFILVIQKQFPLFLMLSFVLVALNIVKDVVHEKERKLKVGSHFPRKIKLNDSNTNDFCLPWQGKKTRQCTSWERRP